MQHEQYNGRFGAHQEIRDRVWAYSGSWRDVFGEHADVWDTVREVMTAVGMARFFER
jgi:hypothetical protein